MTESERRVRTRKLSRSPGSHGLRDVLVLAYHAVSESWPAALSVTPGQFERQLEILSRWGYQGATFSQAVLAPPASRTVAITFDDAYLSVYDRARPLLARYGFPGTVFVPTAFAGLDGPMAWPGIDQWLGGEHESELTPMDWDRLRDLAHRGWEIGSHTHSHPRLTGLGDDALAEELLRSRRECERRLDGPCQSLSYPYGDHDARVVDATRTAGYATACTLPARIHASQPLRWPRVGVYHEDVPGRFRLKASPTVRRARRLARR
jgi:peptidoglycan/xylan/chitin deacetylase (PgdA/CDA1 family)